MQSLPALPVATDGTQAILCALKCCSIAAIRSENGTGIDHLIFQLFSLPDRAGNQSTSASPGPPIIATGKTGTPSAIFSYTPRTGTTSRKRTSSSGRSTASQARSCLSRSHAAALFLLCWGKYYHWDNYDTGLRHWDGRDFKTHDDFLREEYEVRTWVEVEDHDPDDAGLWPKTIMEQRWKAARWEATLASSKGGD
ncbi:hypothetical protein C8J57DRAFT_1228437 [Mycena rebaudengoi]|nr:hypothetical protein C8J57DRAFT_1228437 [Mycena rebaudengoi]